LGLAQESRDVPQLARNDAPLDVMLFADVSNWTSVIKSPNLNVSLLAFTQVSSEYERLAFGPAELKIAK
jgi:hypothetical protein